MKADLHMHSIYSDGELTPKELIEVCHKKNLDVVALTDHDTLMGVSLMIKEGEKAGIRVIPGLELSTYSKEEPIHILAYFKDLESIPKDFINYLTDMMKKRHDRLKEMTKRVNEIYHLNIDFSEIEKAHSYMLERPHLAYEISKQKKVSIRDAFDKYIGNNSKAYIPSSKITTEEGIRMIKNAGGVPVLAHPYEIKKNDPIDIISLGVIGIEAYYGPIDSIQYKKYIDIANNMNLLMTGGSDFHRENDSKHSPVGTALYSEIELEKLLSFLEK